MLYQKDIKTIQDNHGNIQRSTGPLKGRRANSDPQANLQEQFSRQTFTGSVPPPANIPTSMSTPPELSNAPARTQQNFQLLGNPKVQAILDTLQAGGSSIVDGVSDIATKVKSGEMPDIVKSGIDAVDKIRSNGAFKSMMDGDISGVLSKVAPELSSFPGLQSVYDQSISGASNFAKSVGSSLSGASNTANDVFKSLSNTASSLFSQSRETSGPLESASLSDKQNDVNVAAAKSQSPQSSSGPQMPGPARGSSVLQGDQAPLEVRNSESSIRRLTDMILAFSFG